MHGPGDGNHAWAWGWQPCMGLGMAIMHVPGDGNHAWAWGWQPCMGLGTRQALVSVVADSESKPCPGGGL